MPQAARYFMPERIEDALEALAESPATIAAGCTDLFPATEARALSGPVLDISRIDDMRGITRSVDGLRIGALTTWTEIARADLPPALFALQLAAREVGALQIQNRGTLGGNLCNASPAADGVPALLIVDAEVELQSRTGRRRMLLADFLRGPRQTDRAPDELLVAVHVPAASLDGASQFLKLGARRYLVISIAMVAARVLLKGPNVAQIALAVGACGPVARRLSQVEAAMVGKPFSLAHVSRADVAASLSPIADIRADAAYRTDAALTLTQRALIALGAKGDA